MKSICLAVAFFANLLVSQAQTLQLLGRGALPHEMPVGKTKLGGLSGISYDAATRTFWAVSDDSAYKGGAPRVYQVTLLLDGQDLQPKVRATVILRDEKGVPFPVADCEGIAATGRGAVWVSNEGKSGKNGTLPWLKLFSLTNGKAIRSLPLPAAYLPLDAVGKLVPIDDALQVQGIVSNKSLESCSLSPDLRTLYTANETSLIQEKSPGEGKGGASIFNTTQVRISALDTKSGRCLAQKLYVADNGCLFGSVSDLAALDNQGNLFVLERRVTRLQEGTGACGIRIYKVNLNQEDATDLRKIAAANAERTVPLAKALVYDSRKEGIEDLDNVEGIGLVPLSPGRMGVVVVSDDNFNSIQQTQFLLYELRP